jgi:TetR/AcrR family transcriptional regulator, transcriptional repressor for nem operon
VIAFQERHGRNWRDPFVDFYLGERMQVALDEACGVPTFSADVARADDATCAIYQAELELLVDKLAAGFCGAQARALSLLSVLSGAAAMARAVKDDRLRQEILAAANAAAKAI